MTGRGVTVRRLMVRVIIKAPAGREGRGTPAGPEIREDPVGPVGPAPTAPTAISLNR